MKRLFLIILMLCYAGAFYAQTSRSIQDMEKERNRLREQITESETLLQSTERDVTSQINNLMLLSEQIAERKKYVALLEKDVREIQRGIDALQNELVHLQKDLKEKRVRYEQSVRYLYRNKSIQEKLMFVFSADNFAQMYRRLRYVREYADYQKRQGIQLQHKQKEIEAKQRSLLESRKAKENLLRQGEEEKKKLNDTNIPKAERIANLFECYKKITETDEYTGWLYLNQYIIVRE